MPFSMINGSLGALTPQDEACLISSDPFLGDSLKEFHGENGPKKDHRRAQAPSLLLLLGIGASYLSQVS